MPQLTILKTYVDGSDLLEADLNNAYDSISVFLNTTNIDDTNIQTGVLTGSLLGIGTITNAQISSGAIGTSQFASSAVTSFALLPNLNFPGTAVKENGLNLVVSSTGGARGNAIIRGNIASTAQVISSGEGFSLSVVGSAPPVWTINYGIPFAEVPVTIVSSLLDSATWVITSPSSSSFSVTTAIGSVPKDFSFVSIGPRSR